MAHQGRINVVILQREELQAAAKAIKALHDARKKSSKVRGELILDVINTTLTALYPLATKENSAVFVCDHPTLFRDLEIKRDVLEDIDEVGEESADAPATE